MAALTALLDAHAKDEALRLEEVHAEHRSFVEVLLRDHREALRSQSEAHAAQTAQLLREVLTEHRAELDRVAQAHADQVAQVLSQHREESARPRERMPSEDELRSILVEQARSQHETNQDIAEHIGTLTTIVADLGQTVGMIAMASMRPGDGDFAEPEARADRSEKQTAAPPTPVTLDDGEPRRTSIPAAPGPTRTRVPVAAVAFPRSRTAASVVASDQPRVLQSVDDVWQDVLGVGEEDDAPSGSSAVARAPITVCRASDSGGGKSV